MMLGLGFVHLYVQMFLYVCTKITKNVSSWHYFLLHCEIIVLSHHIQLKPQAHKLFSPLSIAEYMC